MPNPDPSPGNRLPPELELALISLEKARQDLVAVEKWLADEDISDEIIGFHIQQAIEKSFKAILLQQAVDFPHTHNLGRLIVLCEDSGIQVPPEFHPVDVFDRFAVQWRYDLLSAAGQTVFDRQSSYNLAYRIWAWAKDQVNLA
jgi:HEPN domain-containing protein